MIIRWTKGLTETTQHRARDAGNTVTLTALQATIVRAITDRLADARKCDAIVAYVGRTTLLDACRDYTQRHRIIDRELQKLRRAGVLEYGMQQRGRWALHHRAEVASLRNDAAIRRQRALTQAIRLAKQWRAESMEKGT